MSIESSSTEQASTPLDDRLVKIVFNAVAFVSLLFVWYFPFFISTPIGEMKGMFEFHGAIIVKLLDFNSRYIDYDSHLSALWAIEAAFVGLAIVLRIRKNLQWTVAAFVFAFGWSIINVVVAMAYLKQNL